MLRIAYCVLLCEADSTSEYVSVNRILLYRVGEFEHFSKLVARELFYEARALRASYEARLPLPVRRETQA